MKRIIYSIVALLLLAYPVFAQNAKSYVIGFYNLENLFDTYHDEGKNDYEFLPDGSNEWTEVKYEKKLRNMAQVIRAMADENKRFHTILGVSEIENRHVLEDLVMQESIADANYQIVHYDGPDKRGVDVALLYRPDLFTVLESKSIPFTFDSEIEFSMSKEEQANFFTRDILMVRGMLGDEMCAFFVCHLPSRLGGKGQDLRGRGGEIIYEETLRLMEEYPGIKVAAMGDMNDNPQDDSMAKYMHGQKDISAVGEKDYFNPFWEMLEAGYGSLAYRGAWNIYDNILVNSNLVNAEAGTLHIVPIVKKKYYGRVFKQDFMTQQEGQYKGQPFRTFSNGAFIGGYSDHYPTYIVISNK